MLRDDDSRVPPRTLVRWLVPFSLVVIGITLFLTLRERVVPVAPPAGFEAGAP